MVQGIPEGFELAKVGYPEPGEIWLSDSGPVACYRGGDFEHPVAILRKIENNWKRLTLGGWDGVPRPARFRMTKHDPYSYGVVVEHRPFAGWKNQDGLWYRYAEVQNNA